mgnify:CR=1 FL=1
MLGVTKSGGFDGYYKPCFITNVLRFLYRVILFKIKQLDSKSIFDVTENYFASVTLKAAPSKGYSDFLAFVTKLQEKTRSTSQCKKKIKNKNTPVFIRATEVR